jgi:hypothetical protein
MAVSEECASGLGVALNEAQWAAARIDASEARVDLGFVVLTLPEDGPEPADVRRVVRLTGVSRVVVSYRDGRWDDASAAVLPVDGDELDALLEEFGQLPIYGWEFVDAGDEQFRRWRNRLSLDLPCAGSGVHTIDLFQDGASRILDFRAWFEDLEVVDADGREVPLDEFIGGGTRWWDALYAGDERTTGHGIVPLAPDGG